MKQNRKEKRQQKRCGYPKQKLEKKKEENNDMQENVEETVLLESPDVTEDETEKQNDVEDSTQSDYTEAASNTKEQPADIVEKDKAATDNIINTTTFCPHCGKKVRVGVVLLDN